MKVRAVTLKVVALAGDQAFRNGMLSMAQAILTILVYFLVMQQVIAKMGLEALGLWSLTMSLVAFARMLDLGGAGVLARLVATASGDEKRQAQFIDSAAIATSLGFGCLAVAGYFVLEPVLFDSIEPKLHAQAAMLLLGLLVLLPVNAIGLVHLGALDGIGRADMRAGIAIFALLLYVAATLLLIQRHGLMALIYAQFLQQGFASIAARVLLCQRIAPLRAIPLNFCRERFEETFSFGVRLQLSAIPMAVFDPLCRLMIGRAVGLDLLGIYELASKFAASSRLVVQAFANPIMPELARLMGKDHDAARRLYGKRQPVISTAAMLVSIGQILALPILSYVLLGRIDAQFVLVASLLSLAWGISCIGLMPQLYARAAGQVQHAIIGQWVLLASGFTIMSAASLLSNPLWMLIAPTGAIVFGHLLAFLREIRYFGLQASGEGKLLLVFGSGCSLMLLATAVVATSMVFLNS